MDNPINTVKSSLTPGKIIALLVGLAAIFTIFDFAGITDWILYPVTSFKAKFGKG